MIRWNPARRLVRCLGFAQESNDPRSLTTPPDLLKIVYAPKMTPVALCLLFFAFLCPLPPGPELYTRPLLLKKHGRLQGARSL